MTKFKKVLAGTIAAVSIMSSALCVGASAYIDSSRWELYTNPNASRSTTDLILNYYSGGYRAVITSKGNGGAANYVTITQKGTYMSRLTEVGVTSQIFKSKAYVDAKGELYAPFTVTLSTEIVPTSTAYNNGFIQLSNLF